jgi:hypothetical protein
VCGSQELKEDFPVRNIPRSLRSIAIYFGHGHLIGDYYKKIGNDETFSLPGEGQDADGNDTRCEMMGSMRRPITTKKWYAFHATFDLCSAQTSTVIVQILSESLPSLQVRVTPNEYARVPLDKPTKNAHGRHYEIWDFLSIISLLFLVS